MSQAEVGANDHLLMETIERRMDSGSAAISAEPERADRWGWVVGT